MARRFKDDQSVFQNPGSTELRQRRDADIRPDHGSDESARRLRHSRNQHLQQGSVYGQRRSWLDLYGQFLYSQPDTTVNYQQADTGNLLLQSQLLFYTSQQYLVSAAAKLPHTSGSFGAEIRPLRRVRIIESWLTDRLHNAGSATSTQTLPNRRLPNRWRRCWLPRW